MQDRTDDELLLLFGRGDGRAAEELYRLYSAPVRAAIARRLGRDRADDATQDAFARLWERPERFDPSRGSLRNFLIRDGVGRGIDRWRSETTSARRTEAFHRTGLSDSGAVDEDTAMMIRSYLNRLTQDQRDAIYLAYWGGFFYSEVAHLLGIAEGTAKARIRSGLRTLKVLLDDAGLTDAA